MFVVSLAYIHLRRSRGSGTSIINIEIQQGLCSLNVMNGFWREAVPKKIFLGFVSLKGVDSFLGLHYVYNICNIWKHVAVAALWK